jgi:hypothetical protein
MQLPELEAAVTCPQCGGAAEPEQDGDMVYQSCPGCGAEFGFRRVQQDGPLCAAGLPVEIVTAAAQPPGVVTLASGEERKTVFFGPVIKRRPE